MPPVKIAFWWLSRESTLHFWDCELNAQIIDS